MTDAYRCDYCNSFSEGTPTIRVDLSIDVNAGKNSFIGGLFNQSDGSRTIDLCSIECYHSADLNALRDEVLADLDSKNELLDANGASQSTAVKGGVEDVE